MFKQGLSSTFRKTNYKLYLALALGVLLFLSGCKSAQLQAIEDSTSVLHITTGREVNRWIEDKGVSLGKPVYAKVLIEYEPINNHTRKELYEEIVAILKKNNWQGSEPIPNYDFFDATLQQSGFEISGGISIDAHKNLVTVVMTIH